MQNWIIKLKKIYLKTSREFWCRIWKNRKKFLRINKISCEMLKDFLHMQQKINQTVTNSRTVTPLNETVTHMSQSFFFLWTKISPFALLHIKLWWNVARIIFFLLNAAMMIRKFFYRFERDKAERICKKSKSLRNFVS